MQLPTLLTRTRREPTPPPEENAKEPAEEESGIGTNLLGRAVKSVVKNFDASALGVKVELGEVQLDALSGKISVDNVLIRNPAGYYSEYLLRAGKMIVDVDLKVLLTSMGKTLEIEEVDFQDVDVIYETGLTTSNVDDVNKKLQSLNPACSGKAATKAPSQDTPELILHKVAILNFGVKATSTLTRGMGPRFVMADVVHQDFEKEMNPSHDANVALSIIVQSLLFSAMGTAIARRDAGSKKTGKSLSSLATTASETGSAAAESAMQGMRSMASAVSSRFSKSTDAVAEGLPAGEQASTWDWLAACRICEQPTVESELRVEQPETSQAALQGN